MSTAERRVTDTWADSPAKRELADAVHVLAQHLQVSDERLARIKAICDRNECDMTARQILQLFDAWLRAPRGREMLWPRP